MKKLTYWITGLFVGTVALGTAFYPNTPCEDDLRKPVRERIEVCAIDDVATFKGREVARTVALGEYEREQYRVEVVDIHAIEGGVEVFMRAWKDGEQLGFGSDGSVDIERLRMFNPSTTVFDPEGDIVHEFVDDRGTVRANRAREDLEEALRQDIITVLRSKQLVFDSKNIVAGKVGRTTSTFRPVAGQNSPIDGSASLGGQDVSWSAIRGNAGNSGNHSETERELLGSITSSATTDGNWRGMARGIVHFDTAAIPDTDTIISASLTLRQTGAYLTQVSGTRVVVTASGPASDATIAASDYNLPGGWGTTKFSSSVLITSIVENDTNVFNLNSAGVAFISKTGLTRLGGRIEWDIDNEAPPAQVTPQKDSLARFATADHTTEAWRPLLTVEHEAAASAADTNFSVKGGTLNVDSGTLLLR